MQWDQVRLFRSQAEAEEARERAESLPQLIPLFTRLSFDGRLWEAEKQGDRVVLRPEVGTALTPLNNPPAAVPRHGCCYACRGGCPIPTFRGGQNIAAWRWSYCFSCCQSTPQHHPGIYVRRGRDGHAALRAKLATQLPGSRAWYGCGYLGLLDKSARRGNRAPRVDTASKQLLETFLRTHYAAPQAKRRSAVYALYRGACVKEHVSPVSRATFYRECALFTTPEVTATRHGRRAAYPARSFSIALYVSLPVQVYFALLTPLRQVRA